MAKKVYSPYRLRQARAWAQAVVWNLGKGGWLPAEMSVRETVGDGCVQFHFEHRLDVHVSLRESCGQPFESWWPHSLQYKIPSEYRWDENLGEWTLKEEEKWVEIPQGAWPHLAPSYGSARLGRSVEGNWDSLREENPPRVTLNSHFHLPFPKGWVEEVEGDLFWGDSLLGPYGHYKGRVGPLGFEYHASEPADAKISFWLIPGEGPRVAFQAYSGQDLTPEEFRRKLDPDGMNGELEQLLIEEG